MDLFTILSAAFLSGWDLVSCGLFWSQTRQIRVLEERLVALENRLNGKSKPPELAMDADLFEDDLPEMHELSEE